jgi:DNA mismatch repair protein MutL
MQVQEIPEISVEDLAAETWTEQAKNIQNNIFASYFKEEKKIDYFLIKQKYITALYEEEILIIDWTRAYHRIEFEKIITEWACKKILTQTLLFPLQIGLNTREFEHFKWMEKEFEELGFEISILSNAVIGIHAAPAAFIHLDLTELIIDLLSNKTLNQSVDKLNKNETIAKILSQHLAHKKLQKLEPLAVQNIILNLFNCEDPKFCPDGKVIFFKINQKEIEKKLN